MWSATNTFAGLSPIAGYKNAEALGVATVGGAHWAVGGSKSGPQPAHATLWKMP